jgi:hypothetical protein
MGAATVHAIIFVPAHVRPFATAFSVVAIELWRPGPLTVTIYVAVSVASDGRANVVSTIVASLSRSPSAIPLQIVVAALILSLLTRASVTPAVATLIISHVATIRVTPVIASLVCAPPLTATARRFVAPVVHSLPVALHVPTIVTSLLGSLATAVVSREWPLINSLSATISFAVVVTALPKPLPSAISVSIVVRPLAGTPALVKSRLVASRLIGSVSAPLLSSLAGFNTLAFSWT